MKADPYLAATGLYLGGWPSSYLSIDLETNGMAVNDPRVLPVEIGWCLVQDREVVLNDAITLDWFLELSPEDSDDFAARLCTTSESMAAKGNRYPFTPRYLEKNGVSPREAVSLVTDKLAEAILNKIPIVGHNFWPFDRPILERSARDWTGRLLGIPAFSVIDTMCIERGRVKKKQVAPSGPRQAWYEKLSRGPERCGLQSSCPEVYGYAVDPEKSHGAAYDALLVSQLLEAMRRASS